MNEVAKAITEGFKLVGQIISGAEQRRVSAAIEHAERFIRRWEAITPEQNRDPLLLKHMERFFAKNN